MIINKKHSYKKKEVYQIKIKDKNNKINKK